MPLEPGTRLGSYDLQSRSWEEHRAAEIAVVVSLKDDDRERTLDLRDCFRSDRGWVITERVSLLLSSPR